MPEGKKYALLLIIGLMLVAITMTLHPVGGSIEHLIHISNVIIGTHAVAILSVPFTWLGFFGLTGRLGFESIVNQSAFAIMSVGMLAVMLAAASNGLVVPVFLNHFKDDPSAAIGKVEFILTYSFSFNQAMDLIFIGACCLAVIAWSIVILVTRRFPVWTAYVGIVAGLVGIITMLSGVVLIDLRGFRWFISAFGIWTLLMTYYLWNMPETSREKA